ncbi:MAG: sulfite exporter TauE/SafE family protein [Clostridia bacterium]|nr:sulfite exporter TauE/SafE family protein [Clostridia bacterium]
MDLLIKILVCILAGLGAGVGTGFAGMSASAVITPILIVLLGVNPYTAVGIALASDVLASAVSTITYRKNKNTSIRKAFPLFISVIVFTIIGSFAGYFLPDEFLGSYSMIIAIFLGIKFLVKPIMTDKNTMHSFDNKYFTVMSVVAGAIVGFICGFVGGGGGLTLLFVLTTFLGYELKTAVGTSVFIMTFTAFTGAVSHFVMKKSELDYLILVLCVIFTLIFAIIASKIANKQEHKKLNRIVGIVLIVLGVGLTVLEISKTYIK